MDRADYPRCATCKWWAQSWYRNAAGTVIMRDYGYCALADQGDDGAVHPESLAHAAGDSMEAGVTAELLTAPDFGCVQHEPREETDGSVR